MTSRSRFALAIAVIDMLAFFVAAILDPGSDIRVIALFTFGIGAYVGIGVLLVDRVPTNPIGALMLATGTLGTATIVVGTYANVGVLQSPRWPGVEPARTMADAMFIYPVLVALVLIPLVFPDGRLPSPRFRWVVLLTIAGMIGWLLGSLFDIEVEIVVLVSLPVALGGAVTAITFRFRRGDPIQRQQVKWLAALVIVGAVAVLLGLFLTNDLPDLSTGLIIVGLLALFAMPFVIGIAILRYRLYEIDRLVSRSIAYAVVTGGLIVTFLAVNLGLTTALSSMTGADSVAVAAATLIVAALFTPLRRRVQRVVDHRFDRARYDAEQTVLAFSSRLRDEVDLPAVTADLDATVRAAIAPTSVGVWLRAPAP
jgi:hypothetical protein